MLCSVQGFAVCMAERQRETNQWQGISGVHVVCIVSKGVSSTWALARVARGRREIENRLRSVREDECRARKRHAPANLSTTGKFAMVLLRHRRESLLNLSGPGIIAIALISSLGMISQLQ